MRILRVKVPHFRNLRDLDITFEENIKPQIFPIGSQNGGGKSTFLQLIFALLHCAPHQDRHPYLINLLKHLNIQSERLKNGKQLVAEIELLWKGESICLSFFLDLMDDERIKYHENSELLQTLEEMILQNSRKLERVEASMREEEFWLENDAKKITDLQYEVMNNPELYGNYVGLSSEKQNRTKKISFAARERTKVVEAQEKLRKEIWKNPLFPLFHLSLDGELRYISCQIKKRESSPDNPTEKVGPNAPEDTKILLQISEKIFLAGPSSQPYLFLGNTNRSLLQKSVESEANFTSHLFQSQEDMPNFYVYNHSAVSSLLQAFQKAKDADWNDAVELHRYGGTYQALVDELHELLVNKHITPNKELDTLRVRLQQEDKTFVELHPEDLSHGELKRVGLYAWIKLQQINGAVVLLDELENGLHPDWQLDIVRELEEWGDNQYILATHSYELCQALTPRHAKEIGVSLVASPHTKAS